VSLLEGAAVAVVGIEPPELIAAARQTARRAVSAGSEGWADVHPASWRLGQDGRGHVEIDGCRFVLPVVGRHQVDNAMLAWAVARELRLDLAAVARALERVSLPPGRGQVLRHGDLTVLHDAYNANPRSVVASLETAVAMSRGRPLVFVLGSMLELGSESDRWHRDVASRAVELEPSLVAAVGAFVPAFEAVGQELGDRLLTAPDPVTLGPLLKARLSGDELVVLKASRGQRLERLIPFLVPDGEAPCSITS
jgi:UDP-N-acetylmuramoyl-tripeptide--D-alanyl-D-alanine ligase